MEKKSDEQVNQEIEYHQRRIKELREWRK